MLEYLAKCQPSDIHKVPPVAQSGPPTHHFVDSSVMTNQSETAGSVFDEKRQSITNYAESIFTTGQRIQESPKRLGENSPKYMHHIRRSSGQMREYKNLDLIE